MKKLIVETDKLKHNIDIIRNMTDSTIIAVIKGNGYGLGLLQYASFLLENSIDFFAVAELSEAMLLRSSGFNNNILLLSSTCIEEQAEVIAANNIIPTIGSVNSAIIMNKACKKLGIILDVHLKIDTGFGRFGFLAEDLSQNYDCLKSLDSLKITGTYSHLSSSFAKDSRSVIEQFQKFMKCIEGLNYNGIDTGMLHMSNSCAFLRHKEIHLDAVRIGSVFLGRLPLENRYDLKRLGYIESEIIELKELPDKYHIGYAGTFETWNRTQIGIIPVGYRDGFGVEKARDTFRFRDVMRYMYNDLLSLGKKSFVMVNSQKARILGKISMHNIVVDLTGIDAQIGDKAILEVNPLMVDSSVIREYV